MSFSRIGKKKLVELDYYYRGKMDSLAVLKGPQW